MPIILGIDGLEYSYVREFECRHLMQRAFGKTDITEFEEPRTVVLWSSFLAGRNLEREIVSMGNERMWDFRLAVEETFFREFRSFKAVDVPGYNYSRERHLRERELLRRFFSEEIAFEEFEGAVLEYHEGVKQGFLSDLDEEHGLLFYYFNAVDLLGHLSFGLKDKMRYIYGEFDWLAGRAAQKGEPLLIVSDHGMKAVGRFGDHRENYGFWANSLGLDLGTPRISDLFGFVVRELRR